MTWKVSISDRKLLFANHFYRGETLKEKRKCGHFTRKMKQIK